MESSVVLAYAAERYGFKPGQLVQLQGGHFTYTYEFPIEDEKFILRITPPNDEIDLQDMNAILKYLDHLAAHSVSVPIPQRSRTGVLVESVQHENQQYLLAVFKKVVGTLAESQFPDRWGERLTSSLGSAAGKMHAASSQYRPETGINRPAWDETDNCFNPPGELAAEHRSIARKQKEVYALIRSLPKREESYGLIHTDLHFANFLVNQADGKVTIIDFDDCSYGWYVMDIAMLLLDLTVLYTGPEKKSYARDFLQQFLISYQQEFTLDRFWIQKLPLFLKLLEIGLFKMLYRDYDPEDRESWVGRFMAGRKERIENDIPVTEIDFGSLVD